MLEQWSITEKEKKTQTEGIPYYTGFNMFIGIKPTKVYFDLEKLDRKGLQ